jgi:hypothetical protein
MAIPLHPAHQESRPILRPPPRHVSGEHPGDDTPHSNTISGTDEVARIVDVVTVSIEHHFGRVIYRLLVGYGDGKIVVYHRLGIQPSSFL